MIDILFIYINNKAPIFSPDTIPISEGYILTYLKQRGFSGQVLVDSKDRPLSLPTLKDFLEREISFKLASAKVDFQLCGRK